MTLTGREYQHLEDLVFCEEQGAHRALYILKNLRHFTVSIKWDGNPTIYFGRNSDGKFTLVGKNGWGKDWINTPEELEQWTLSRGKREPWRPEFAKSLADMWRLLEPHCDFPGFVYADVLWNPAKPYILGRRNGSVFFMPNQVTYTVPPNADLYKEIVGSKLGLAAHSKFEFFGDTTGQLLWNSPKIKTNDIVVVPQSVMPAGIDIPNEMILALEKKIKKNESKIESLFFHRQGLSDFRDIIYRYVNYMNRIDAFDDLTTLAKFKDWIDVSKLSFNKQGRMRDIIDSNKDEFETMFIIFLDIVAIKNTIINSFDTAPAMISSYSFNGQRGGEGYIVQEPKVKLVPRNRWKPTGISEFDVTDLFS